MPVKYTITTADGKSHQVSKENIDKFGMQAYADEYDGATIRMRDDDGADYDVPLYHYDDAVADNLHAFSTETYNPNTTVMRSVGEGKWVKEEKPAKVSDEARKRFANEQGEERKPATPNKASNASNDNGDVAQVSQKPVVPWSEFGQGGTYETPASQWAGQHLENIRQKEAERNAPVNPNAPGASISVGDWQKEVDKNINSSAKSMTKGIVDDILAKADEKYGASNNGVRYTGMIGRSLGITGQLMLNKMVEEDKEKYVEDVLKDLLGNQASKFKKMDKDTGMPVIDGKIGEMLKSPEFAKKIQQDANVWGIDPKKYAAFVGQTMANQILSELQKKEIAQYIPKNKWEYIVGGLQNSIAGYAYRALTETPRQANLREQAIATYEQENDPSVLTSAARGVLPMVTLDAPIFGFGGKVAGAVLQSVARREVMKLAEKVGLREARRIIGAKLENSISSRISAEVRNRMISNAINFGFYDMASEAGREATHGDIQPWEIAKAGGKGGATGAIVGAVGGAIGGASAKLRGGQKAAAKVVDFGAEVGTFTTTGIVANKLMGQDDHKSIGENLIENAVFIGMMKGTGALSKMKNKGESVRESIINNFRNALNPTEYSPVKLSREEMQEIEDASGHKFADALDKMASLDAVMRNHRNASKEGGKAIDNERQMSEAEKQAVALFEQVINNPDVRFYTRQKLSWMLGSKMAVVTPETTHYDTRQEGDTFTITTRDKYGNAIDKKVVTGEDAFNEAVRETQDFISSPMNRVMSDPTALEYIGKEMISEQRTSAEELTRFLSTQTTGKPEATAEYNKKRRELWDEYDKATTEEEKNAIEAKIDALDEENTIRVEAIRERDKELAAELVTRYNTYAKPHETDYSEVTAPMIEDKGNNSGGNIPVNGNNGGENIPQGEEPAVSDRRQAAYDRGYGVAQDASQLPQANLDLKIAEARMNVLFPKEDKDVRQLRNSIIKAVNEGDDATADMLLEKYGNMLSKEQREAIEAYTDASEMSRGIEEYKAEQIVAYTEQRKAELANVTGEEGLVVPLTLSSGETVYLKSKMAGLDNKYGAVYVIHQNGEETMERVGSIANVGTVQNPKEMLDIEVSVYGEQLESELSAIANGDKFLVGSTAVLMLEDGPKMVHVDTPQENGNFVFSDMETGRVISMTPAEAKQAYTDAQIAMVERTLAEEAKNSAVAAQQKRFADGIEGYADGNVNMFAPKNDAKAVAEYLALQGIVEGGKKPSDVVKDEIDYQQSRIEQAKKDIATDEAYMDANGDLLNDGQRRELEERIAGAKSRLADAEGKQKKALEVRGEVMTPEENTTMREARKKERDAAVGNVQHIENMPISNEDIDKTTDVPENGTKTAEEILDMRKQLKVYQDELTQKIKNIESHLDSWENGDIDLSKEEVNGLANQYVGLQDELGVVQGRQGQLKNVKPKINKPAVPNLKTPDGRAAYLGGAKNSADLAERAKKVYGEELGTLEPETFEEIVASSLVPHSILWESEESATGAIIKRGLKDEIGSSMTRGAYGRKGDTSAVEYFIAGKGKGASVDEIAHGIWEDLNDSLREQYDTQDIKNAILDMLMSAERPSDISRMVLNNRIAMAEEALQYMEEQESEYQRMEAEHLRESALEYEEFLARMKEYALTDEDIQKISGIFAEAAMEADDLRNGINTSVKQINTESNDTGRVLSESPGAEGGNGVDIKSAERAVREGSGESQETLRRKAVGGQEGLPSDTKQQRSVGAGQESADGKTGADGKLRVQNEVSGRGGEVKGSEPNGANKPDKANISTAEAIASAEAEVNINPTEAQKKAGNYKMGHVTIDGHDITIENPKGSVRSGVDANGDKWETKMNNTYGYIRGTEGVDGDHIDVFLSDTPEEGKVFVVDQRNSDGSFDEHKVMYGFQSADDAKAAYLSNYEKGWDGLGAITEVSKEDFKKWIDSSHRKTKPFAEYAAFKDRANEADKPAGDIATFNKKDERVQISKTSTNRYGEDIYHITNGYGGTSTIATKDEARAVSIAEGHLSALMKGDAVEGIANAEMAQLVADYRGAVNKDAREASSAYDDFEKIFEDLEGYSDEELRDLKKHLPLYKDKGLVERIDDIIEERAERAEKEAAREQWRKDNPDKIVPLPEKYKPLMDAVSQYDGSRYGGEFVKQQRLRWLDDARKDIAKILCVDYEQGNEESLAALKTAYENANEKTRKTIDKAQKAIDKAQEDLEGLINKLNLGHIEAVGDDLKPGEQEKIEARYPAIFEEMEKLIYKDSFFPKSVMKAVKKGGKPDKAEKPNDATADIMDEVERRKAVAEKRAKVEAALAEADKKIKSKEEQRAEAMEALHARWKELKEKHPDALLLFNTGKDHGYLAYNDDAKVLADILRIPLGKGRGKFKNAVNFQHNAIDSYLPRLIRAGRRVAICDLLDAERGYEPSEILSPGNTVSEPTLFGKRPKGKGRPGEVQLELFGSGDEVMTHTGGLPTLEPGEFSLVERTFNENGYFGFSGGKVESAADVAYILRNLENKAVENAFAVLVTDGKPTVIHLGMGGFAETYANAASIKAGVEKFGADQIYFVHNHPSGNLLSSRQDRALIGKLYDMYPDKMQDGIIIDTTSGKYGVYNNWGDVNNYDRAKDSKGDEQPLAVKEFDKLVFSKDYDASKLQTMDSPDKVAAFVSSQRLGDRKKVGVIVLDQKMSMVGNYHLPFKNLEADVDGLANELARVAITGGGRVVIPYGNFAINGNKSKAVGDAVERLSGGTISVMDVISSDGYSHLSARDEGYIYEPEQVLGGFNNKTAVRNLNKPNGANEANKPAADIAMEDVIQFQIGNKKRKEMEAILQKQRPDLTDEQREAFFKYMDGLENTKLEKATFLWFKNGAITLPEDGYKVEAVRDALSKNGSIDPMRYKSPAELLNEHAPKVEEEVKINPVELAYEKNSRKVKYLSKGRKVGNVMVYDMKDNKDAAKHFCENVMQKFYETSPWCLMAWGNHGEWIGDDMWGHYNTTGRKVAFDEDGKPVAFFSSDDERPTWWDETDEPHQGVPVTIEMPNDKLGRMAIYEMNEETGKMSSSPYKMFKGTKKEGHYQEWSEEGYLTIDETRKHHQLEGEQKIYSPYNGKLRSENHYHNGMLHGVAKQYRYDGKVASETEYKDGQQDGKETLYEVDGSVRRTVNYKRGKLHGKEINYDSDGNIESVRSYANGRKDGVWMMFEEGKPTNISFYVKGAAFYPEDSTSKVVDENGNLNGLFTEKRNGKRFEIPFKNNEISGTVKITDTVSGYKVEDLEYKNDKQNGRTIGYYAGPEGLVATSETFSDGLRNGVAERYSSIDGGLTSRTIYKDGQQNGPALEYRNGKLYNYSTFNGDQPSGPQFSFDKQGFVRDAEFLDEDFNVRRREINQFNGSVEVGEYDKNGKLIKSYEIPMSESVLYGMTADKAIAEAENAFKKEVVTEAVMKALDETGVEYSTDAQKMAEVYEAVKELQRMAKKSAGDTGLEGEPSLKDPVISSADIAKITKKLENLARKYDEKSQRISTNHKTRTFIGDIARELGAVEIGKSGSQYIDIEPMNGETVTLRLANHNASTIKADNHGETNGISIVISRKPDNGIERGGKAHIVEFFYPEVKLNNAGNNALPQIIRAIEQILYSGQYKDPTGIVVKPDEVNSDVIQAEIHAYHGTAADFDAFDHSHMGEGEGNQSYGWGTYLTGVEGIGKAYATQMARRGRNNNLHIKVLENGVWQDYHYDPVNLENRTDRAVSMAYDVMQNFRTIREARDTAKRFIDLAEDPTMKEAWQNVYDFLKAHKKSDIKAETPRFLYDVEIPEDNGKNYLEWDKPFMDTERLRKYILKYAKNKDIPEDRAERFVNALGKYEINGETVYKNIAKFLASDEQTSRLLAEAGFVGVRYPAEYQTGGREDNAKNYVIFNEADAKITDKTQFLRTKEGEVYGFVYKGKMYLDGEKLNPNTPIHEYTHLWDTALQKKNPELWKRGVELMKQTALWQEVVSDPAYKDIAKDENLVASEVHSRLTGAEGEKILSDMYDEAKAEQDGMTKVEKLSLLGRLRAWIKDAWQWVKDTMTPWTKEEAEKVDLKDFVNMTLKDFFEGKGVEPNGADGANTTVQKRFIGEKGAELADKAEERTVRMDNLAVARDMEAQKKDALAIKIATGWERGADKKWRYEEPDEVKGAVATMLNARDEVAKKLKRKQSKAFKAAGKLRKSVVDNSEVSRVLAEADRLEQEGTAAMKEANALYSEYTSSLADVLGKDHLLLKEYPSLKDVKVVYKDLGIETNGSWNSDTRTLYINSRKTEIEEEGLSMYGKMSVEELENLHKRVESLEKTRRYYSARDERSKKAGEQLNAIFKDLKKQSGGAILSEYSLDRAVRQLKHYEKNGDEGERTLVHELQHCIQTEEGFARGGNPEMMGRVMKDRYVAAGKHLDEIAEKHGLSRFEIMDEGFKTDDAELSEARDSFLKAQKSALDSNFENYKKIAGEAESRNSTDRMDMTAEERRNSLRTETQDVSDEDLLFLTDEERKGDGKSESESIRFRFIGERGAKNADAADRFMMREGEERMKNLELARKMEEGGDTPRIIKIATGWERGADKKWRYEVDDDMWDVVPTVLAMRKKAVEDVQKEFEELSNREDEWGKKVIKAENEWYGEHPDATYTDFEDAHPELKAEADAFNAERTQLSNKRYRLQEGYTTTLGDILDKHQLFEEYPDLAETKVKIIDMPNVFNGSYDPKSNEITLNLAGRVANEGELFEEDVTGTLVHEIQHAVQFREGFATGGNARSVRKAIEDELEDRFPNAEWAEEKGKVITELKYRDFQLEMAKEYAADPEKYVGNTMALALAAKNIGKEYKDIEAMSHEEKVNAIKRLARDWWWEVVDSFGYGDNPYFGMKLPKSPYPEDGSEIADADFDRIHDEAWSVPNADEMREAINTRVDALDKDIEGSISKDELAEYRRYKKMLDAKDDRELYARLAGEVEARNVTNRMGMSDEERRRILASKTQDVRSDDQVFLYDAILGNNEPNEANKPTVDREVVVAEATALGDKLGGVEVTVEDEHSELPAEVKKAIAEGTVKGWYDPNDGSVHLYAPSIESVEDAQRTVFHEKLGHEGLKALLGSDEEVMKWGNFIWKSASKDIRKRILERADKEGYEWTDPQRFSKAAQEVFSDIASNGPRSAEEFSLWRKVKHYLIKALKALGIRIKGILNDEDLAYYVAKTTEALKKNKPNEANKPNGADRAEANEPNKEEKPVEVLFSRERKPRKRKDESWAQYVERVRNFEREKIAYEKARENGDPEPTKDSFDQKAEDAFKKAMDEWKAKNGISTEEDGAGAFPKRGTDESVQDYANRVAEYEQKNDLWKTAPHYFDYVKKADEEYRKSYTEWRKRYDLQDEENVDLNMYDGKESDYKPESDLTDSEIEARTERDLAEAIGVDTTVEGAKRMSKLAVIERRKDLESMNAEDAIFLHDLNNDIAAEAKAQGVKPEELNKALPFLIEAELLKDAVDENGEPLATIPAELAHITASEALLKKVSDWYTNFYNVIEEAGLRGDAGFIPDHYVNHVWDKEKSDPKAYQQYVENRQRMKSPNMKHREIMTYMEGIAVGLAPKFEKLTDMMAYYSSQNNQAVANTRFLQRMSGFVVNEYDSKGEVVKSKSLMSSVEPSDFERDDYAKYYVPGVGNLWVYKPAARRFETVFGKMRTFETPNVGTKIGKVYDSAAGLAKKAELAVSFFHHGALSEVSFAQNGVKDTTRAILQYIIADSVKHKTTPAYAHPEDFKLAARHLVQLGATQDYAAADVQGLFDTLHEKMKGVTGVSEFTKLLAKANEGMDTMLWSYLHDGLKVFTFKRFAERINAEAEKNGWAGEKVGKMMDEAGQYVNDLFGGQYFELINLTPAEVKWLRRLFLSPDWLISTSRQFFATSGFGSLYATEGLYQYWKDDFKRMFGKDAPKDDFRTWRAKNGAICNFIGMPMLFLFWNGVNAVMRALDEDDEKKKAEEMRKVTPDYKSPYELAYPDGMKWYDYTMLGNSLGQATHLFMGRYADGTERYVRWGKQFREIPEMFIGRKGFEIGTPAMERMLGKTNPWITWAIRDIPAAYGIFGWQGMGSVPDWRSKYGNNITALAVTFQKFLPFSVPTQTDKEFKGMDLVMPSQKGFSRFKTIDYFKDYIMKGDMEGIDKVYKSATMNGIDAEKCLKAAMNTLDALKREEMSDGVVDVQTAMEKFDGATTLKEKKHFKNKMVKYLAGEEYKVFTREDAREKVESYLNGDVEEIEKTNDKYLMKASAEDIREDYHLSRVNKIAKQYYDAVKEAYESGDPDRAERLTSQYQRWLEVYSISRKARNHMAKLKKSIDHEDGIMEEIRRVRAEAMSEIDNIKR